jgi:hypothetical protein
MQGERHASSLQRIQRPVEVPLRSCGSRLSMRKSAAEQAAQPLPSVESRRIARHHLRPGLDLGVRGLGWRRCKRAQTRMTGVGIRPRGAAACVVRGLRGRKLQWRLSMPGMSVELYSAFAPSSLVLYGTSCDVKAQECCVMLFCRACSGSGWSGSWCSIPIRCSFRWRFP